MEKRYTATEVAQRQHELLSAFGPPPSYAMSEEDRLRWIIRQIHEKAHRDAQPFIDQLVKIETLKPPKPIFVDADKIG